MMRSLYSAVSGLKTHQTKMDVIGNNIANVNTVAFKSSSVTFSEVMYQTLSNASGATTSGLGGVNAKQIGLGTAAAATNVSITTSGAAQTTGNPFDIRLTDSNSTNFFIVNNGSENLFTRAGSFYIDGTGNLCMTSTGYTLMGWQVDDNGNIQKDTVSALRIMQEKNLTSAPEATTNASVAGVIDKNDTNVTSDTGYIMNLNFYDSLGYQYTCKFSVTEVNGDQGTYAVEVADILDSDGNSILSEYLTTGNLSDIFGENVTLPSQKYSPSDSDFVYITDDMISAGTYTGPDGTTITTAGWYHLVDSVYSQTDATTYSNVYVPITMDITNDAYTSDTYYTDSTMSSTVSYNGTLTDLFDVSATDLASAAWDTTNFPGQLVVYRDTSAFYLQFDTADGTFSYVDEAGTGQVTLNMSALGDMFEDITVDFTQTKNYDNGGSSTLSIDAGDTDGVTGVGKALGAMTGITISNDGKIYGSYDNGNTVLLGQIAVAQFNNASGLEKVGESCYRTTLNSGEFDGIGVEITADGSKMTTGELEMSNVDLSAEFTDMIVTQRGFQANSRVITTSDTLLEELINLKR
ncbi:MAG: flagellar hook-basal body complex protein [Lachnospiraceae bacterium]|nr:flagellar hook-basal body complex protein [Lachnospiraceae bacterium]